MQKIDFIHLVPELFSYGAYGMLSELHYAIDKYYSDNVNQHIISIDPSKVKKYIPRFNLKYDKVNIQDLKTHIKNTYNNPAVFMHKIAKTDCRDVSKILYKNFPFFIINHTQLNRFKGLASANAIIAVSDHMHKSIKSERPGYSVEIIRNGVNADRYRDIKPTELEVVQNYFVTGRMNNFNNTKHPADWIDFIKNQQFNKPLWHDYLGSGSSYKSSKSQSLVKNNKFSHIQNKLHLPGRIDNFDHKVGYIRRWDCFFYEIRGTEGTSMSLLESLACGVPAIINNKPGNHEIIENNVNGFVYNKRDQAVKIINKFIDNPSFLSDMKESTKEHFDKYLDAKIMAKEYVELAQSEL